MVGRDAVLALALRIVVDHELHRIEHGHAPRRARVQVLAHAVFQHAHVDPRIGLRHADALGEEAEAFGREAAAARADERRHPRIVPAVDVVLLDELDQLALRQQDVGQVEAGELVLLRQRPRELPAFGEPREHPVVQRPMVLELERADRVRDPLERVGDACV